VHAEDYDLWLRLSEAHEVANLPDPLLRYRIHSAQLTGRNLPSQAVSALAARILARSRRAGTPEPELPERVDIQFLRRLGAEDSLIAHEIVTAATHWSAVLEELLIRQAAQPLAEAARAAASLEGANPALARLARRELLLAVRARQPALALRAAGRVARKEGCAAVARFGIAVRADLERGDE
jgi:hypothetical protein